MDFFAGSLITLLVSAVVYRLIVKERKSLSFFAPKYTQSYNYRLLKPILGDHPVYDVINEKMRTQATDHFDSKHIRMVIMDDYAYWIRNNVLVCAELNEEGFDEKTTKEVDIMGMDKVELNKMITVVDKLTEGNKHDGGSPGDKKF